MNYRKIIAWAPCWICFWSGDLFSKGLWFDFLNKDCEDGTWSALWRRCWVDIFWKPYQISMHWSVQLNDWGGLDVWQLQDLDDLDLDEEDDDDAALPDD